MLCCSYVVLDIMSNPVYYLFCVCVDLAWVKTKVCLLCLLGRTHGWWQLCSSPWCFILSSSMFPSLLWVFVFCISNNELFPQVIFQITPLNYVEWQAVLAFSLPVVVLDEILKACARIYFGKFDFLFFTFKIDTLTFLLYPQGKNHPAALQNRSSISKGELIKIKINFC